MKVKTANRKSIEIHIAIFVFVSCSVSISGKKNLHLNFKHDSYCHALSRVFQISSKENDKSRKGSKNLKNILYVGYTLTRSYFWVILQLLCLTPIDRKLLKTNILDVWEYTHLINGTPEALEDIDLYPIPVISSNYLLVSVTQIHRKYEYKQVL